MPNITTSIINPQANWGLILKNTLFAGNYITNFIVNLLLEIGVPLNETQIKMVGVVVVLVGIYLIMTLAEKLKPIIKIIIIVMRHKISE